MADKRVSFAEFLETYKKETRAGLHRHSMPVEVDERLTLDLYYYELCLYSEEDDSPNVIIGHPAYTEDGLEAYIGFLHDMGYAVAEKMRVPARPAAETEEEPEEFRDEIWDALLDASGEVIAHEHPVILRRWMMANWPDLKESTCVRVGASGEVMPIVTYLSLEL